MTDKMTDERQYWRDYKPRREEANREDIRRAADKVAADWELTRADGIDDGAKVSRTDYVDSDGDLLQGDDWQAFWNEVADAVTKAMLPARLWNTFISIDPGDNRLEKLFDRADGRMDLLAKWLEDSGITEGMLIERFDDLMPDWRRLRHEILIDQAYGAITGVLTAKRMDPKHRLAAAKIVYAGELRRDMKRMELDHEMRLRAATKRLAEYEKDDADRVAKLSNDEAMVEEATPV